MAKINSLILLLVVMGLIAIHFSKVTSSTSNQDNIFDHEAEKLQREHQLGDSKEEVYLDGKANPDFNYFYRSISTPELARSRSGGFASNDDDHSNVELENLNAGVRYEILPAEPVSANNRMRNIDSSNVARILFKILSSPRQANDLLMTLKDRKRGFRQLALPKEDKDYSFVLQPLSSMNKYYAGRRTLPEVNRLPGGLRDLIITNGKLHR